MDDLYPTQAACVSELIKWCEDVFKRDVGTQLVRLAAPAGWGKTAILAVFCDQAARRFDSADNQFPVIISVRCPTRNGDPTESGFRFLADIVATASRQPNFRLSRWRRELAHVLGLRAPETAAETVGQLLALFSVATGVAAPLGVMVWFAGVARRAGVAWMGGVLGLGLPDLDARCYEAGRLIAAASRDQPFLLAIDDAHAAESYSAALVRGTMSVPGGRVLVVAAGQPHNGELAGRLGELAKAPGSVPGARIPDPTPSNPTTAELTWTIMADYPRTTTSDAGRIAVACRTWSDLASITVELLSARSDGNHESLELKGRDPSALLRRAPRNPSWSGDLERLATGLALIGDRVAYEHLLRLALVLGIVGAEGLTSRLVDDGTLRRVTDDVYEFVDHAIYDHAVRRASAVHTDDERARIDQVVTFVADHAPSSLSVLGRLVVQRRLLDSSAVSPDAKSDAHWQVSLIAAEVGDFASALVALEEVARLRELRVEQRAWGAYWRVRIREANSDDPAVVVDVDHTADPTLSLEVDVVRATTLLQNGDAASCYDLVHRAASTLEVSGLANSDRLSRIRVALAQLALHLSEPLLAARLLEPALTASLAGAFQVTQQLQSLADRRVNTSTLLEFLAHRRAVDEARDSGHPLLLAGALEDLSVLYWQDGRYREGLDAADEVVGIYLDSLGPNHPTTLYARHMRTNFLSADGRLPHALSEIDSVIAARELIFGAVHHHTVASRHNRATILGRMQDWQAALDEVDIVIDLRTRLLGAHNAETLMSRNSRSIYLRHLERTEEALEEISSVVRLRTLVLGAEHPHTLSSHANRASYLFNARAQEGLAEISDVVRIEERVLGHRHPSTLSTRHMRAAKLDEVGQSDDALREVDDVIVLRKAALGVDHESTLRSRYDRARYLAALGRLDEAIDEVAEVVAVCQRVLGTGHVDTLRYVSFRQRLDEQRAER